MRDQKYKLEDLDCNGNPYPDAIPLGLSCRVKPAHWPFVPGERIIIEVPDYRNIINYFSEEVIKVDLSQMRVYTTYGDTGNYWGYTLDYWGIGYKFSKDTGQPGVTKR